MTSNPTLDMRCLYDELSKKSVFFRYHYFKVLNHNQFVWLKAYSTVKHYHQGCGFKAKMVEAFSSDFTENDYWNMDFISKRIGNYNVVYDFDSDWNYNKKVVCDGLKELE